MTKLKKQRIPTYEEAKALRIIARSCLIRTFDQKEAGVVYSTGHGYGVNKALAERLIANGWVRPETPGLFPDSEPQTYKTLKP